MNLGTELVKKSLGGHEFRNRIDFIFFSPFRNRIGVPSKTIFNLETELVSPQKIFLI